MTMCFSKSLCCPSGAVVVGDKALVDKIRVIRKSLGGTMRQTGILTAAGLWALENMPNEVAKDNEITMALARRLGEFK
jgi:threonine aldolase